MTPKQSTPAATLEHQVAADSGLEELPHFDEPSNGHILEGGVKPSERCGTPSELGIGCTFRDEHPGAHSWQPAENTAIAETGNLELPGMPEPEQTDYTVPTEASFKGAKLVAAPGLRSIGDRLIGDDETLKHLLDIEIRYFWRRRGGTQGGNVRYARIKRPGGYEEYFTGGKIVYLIDLSADHVRTAKFADEQIEACVYSQLVQTDVDPDDHDAYRIVGQDFGGSVRELAKFGAWNQDLREMQAHVAKLPPVEQDAEADDDDEADDEAEE